MSYAVKNIEMLTWGREEFVCEHSKWSCAHRHSVKKKENEKEKKKKEKKIHRLLCGIRRETEEQWEKWDKNRM